MGLEDLKFEPAAGKRWARSFPLCFPNIYHLVNHYHVRSQVLSLPLSHLLFYLHDILTNASNKVKLLWKSFLFFL